MAAVDMAAWKLGRQGRPAMSEPNYSTFAEAAKGHRLALGLSLRKFCRRFEFDPGNVSKLERGLLPPPKWLAAYAMALGLQEGEPGWQEFFDLAAAVKCEFPDDLRDDELVRQLPVLFHAMRGNPGPLIELLRKR